METTKAHEQSLRFVYFVVEIGFGPGTNRS